MLINGECGFCFFCATFFLIFFFFIRRIEVCFCSSGKLNELLRNAHKWFFFVSLNDVLVYNYNLLDGQFIVIYLLFFVDDWREFWGAYLNSNVKRNGHFKLYLEQIIFVHDFAVILFKLERLRSIIARQLIVAIVAGFIRAIYYAMNMIFNLYWITRSIEYFYATKYFLNKIFSVWIYTLKFDICFENKSMFNWIWIEIALKDILSYGSNYGSVVWHKTRMIRIKL